MWLLFRLARAWEEICGISFLNDFAFFGNERGVAPPYGSLAFRKLSQVLTFAG